MNNNNWKQTQPDLWELLDADAKFIEYLNTLRPRAYHKAIIERLESLIQNASFVTNPKQFKRDQYRRNAAELYRKNLIALSKV